MVVVVRLGSAKLKSGFTSTPNASGRRKVKRGFSCTTCSIGFSSNFMIPASSFGMRRVSRAYLVLITRTTRFAGSTPARQNSVSNSRLESHVAIVSVRAGRQFAFSVLALSDQHWHMALMFATCFRKTFLVCLLAWIYELGALWSANMTL